MVLRIILFAMMALGLGGFGIIAWVSARPPATVAQAVPEVVAEVKVKVEAPKPPTKVTVLVAGRAVRAGSLLKPEEVTAREYTAETLPEGTSIDTPGNRQALIGAMVRRPLLAGEPLMPDDLMRPGDHGFLAAVLTPGMRAVTVGVDAISGAAGLIWPGDRVDVIMTQAIDDPALPIGRRVAAEVVQRNARVIAIDQQMVQGALPGGAEGNSARTVTIEVTSQQVQWVQVAARIGRLSLSVRSSDTSEPGTDDQTAVYASDVSSALARQPPRLRTDIMRVHSGTSESKEYKFQ
ncbi:MAG: Flp pilus assembly protein CpaB [Acetobacteraceae bacterium]|nr:Flp pilus assembly protein CpaB [Acetobacteraceae bacterium]